MGIGEATEHRKEWAFEHNMANYQIHSSIFEGLTKNNDFFPIFLLGFLAIPGGSWILLESSGSLHEAPWDLPEASWNLP